MSETVYVVMASKGEWSDRYEWVCGVFTDGQQAKATLGQRERASREAHVLREAYRERERREVPRRHSWRLAQEEFVAEDLEHHARRKEWRAANPPPDAEVEAEQFWIVAAPLNQWGKWDAWEEPAT